MIPKRKTGEGLVIITASAHPMLEERLTAAGFEVWYAPAEPIPAIRNRLKDVVGLVVSTRVQVTQEWIEAAPKLQWIGRLGSGMELIDVSYARSKGILCLSSPEGNRQAVAEHVLGLMLAISKRIPLSAGQVKQGIWERDGNRGFEWTGKTMGIVGLGNTGSAVARVVRGLEMYTMAYDRYKMDFGGKEVREVSLEQIARYADVISFHVPLTSETRHMANEAFFRSLKQQPVIINASRGAVVDTAALWMALEEGWISGAGLDVLENERIDAWTREQKELYEKLLHHPRVVITPHIGGYSEQATYKMSNVLLEKLGY